MSDRKRKRPSPTDNSTPASDGAFKKPRKGGPYNPNDKPAKYKTQAKKHSTGPLKKRIRDIKRQLERGENMPVRLRVEHERELAELERDLLVTEGEIQKQENIGRYHKVRFFGKLP
jgi:hypothetical protein